MGIYLTPPTTTGCVYRKTSGGLAVRMRLSVASFTTARVVAGGRTTPAARYRAVIAGFYGDSPARRPEHTLARKKGVTAGRCFFNSTIPHTTIPSGRWSQVDTHNMRTVWYETERKRSRIGGPPTPRREAPPGGGR
jgi:hypothetical protein